jgi:predicted MPP superfamily phosphohydrolase
MKNVKYKMRKMLTITLTVFLMALFILAGNPSTTPNTKAQTLVSGDSFSIMQISDTQFLAVSQRQLFQDTTSWIVNNSANYNLKMVIHTGDIVDNINGTTGQSNDPAQWDCANTAMLKLLNAGIPYCWDAGNHDQIPWNDPAGTWLGSSYTAFNATNMRSKPYWVSDAVDSKNTAVKFAYNNYEFLIINIEYKASNSTLDWMKALIENNRGTNVIIAAHTYLNVKGGYGFSSAGLPGEVAWCTNLRTIIDGYPNVFLTLSGHDPSGSANTTRVGNRQEIFFNRQVVTTSAGQTGSAAVRIYTFNLTSKRVDTTTYMLDNKTWLTNAANQFSFNASLKLPLNAASTQSNTVIAKGNMVTFSATPTGGVSPYSYQWYKYTTGGTIALGTNSSQLQYTVNSYNTEMIYCLVTDAHGATVLTTGMTIMTTQEASNPIITAKPDHTSTVTPQPTIPQATPKPTPQTTIPPTSTPETAQEQFTLSTTVIVAILGIIIIVVCVTAWAVTARKR